MHSIRRVLAFIGCSLCGVVLALALAGCGPLLSALAGGGGSSAEESSSGGDSSKQQVFEPASGKADVTLKIASGSENREAAKAIQKAVDDSGVAVQIDYMGSLDIMQQLKDGGGEYDAVWPASSIWISLGDSKHLVKDEQSTSTTPVVFGIAKKKAVELGWADESGATKSVSTKDVAEAVQAGKLSFSMTSATQSNSGASAYLAFLQALKGSDAALTAADLENDQLTDQVKALLSGVDRSSGSSDWLKDMVVANPTRFDAMVNYESLVIAANEQLTKNGDDPLLAVYPSDGIAVSDSPLGYVDRGQGTEDAFKKFQKALSSDDAKLLLEQAGRRTGLGGVVQHADDKQVERAFRSEWGIKTDASALKAVPMPASDVIEGALNLYQTSLRKPSWTIWVVDYSGSMQGDGKEGVVKGLKAALDPTEAAKSMIQPKDDDVNIFIPFSSLAGTAVVSQGAETQDLLDRAEKQEATGGTNIYAALDAALDALPQNMDIAPKKPSDYTVAVVLMTDGLSDDSDRERVMGEFEKRAQDVPVYSIMFGEADPTQLKEIATATDGKVFDGRKGDLASVFRQVKGYN